MAYATVVDVVKLLTFLMLLMAVGCWLVSVVALFHWLFAAACCCS